jgi:hypothetical protein
MVGYNKVATYHPFFIAIFLILLRSLQIRFELLLIGFRQQWWRWQLSIVDRQIVTCFIIDFVLMGVDEWFSPRSGENHSSLKIDRAVDY